MIILRTSELFADKLKVSRSVLELFLYRVSFSTSFVVIESSRNRLSVSYFHVRIFYLPLTLSLPFQSTHLAACGADSSNPHEVDCEVG